jgi:hypothetical protein
MTLNETNRGRARVGYPFRTCGEERKGAKRWRKVIGGGGCVGGPSNFGELFKRTIGLFCEDSELLDCVVCFKDAEESDLACTVVRISDTDGCNWRTPEHSWRQRDDAPISERAAIRSVDSHPAR